MINILRIYRTVRPSDDESVWKSGRECDLDRDRYEFKHAGVERRSFPPPSPPPLLNFNRGGVRGNGARGLIRAIKSDSTTGARPLHKLKLNAETQSLPPRRGGGRGRRTFMAASFSFSSFFLAAAFRGTYIRRFGVILQVPSRRKISRPD